MNGAEGREAREREVAGKCYRSGRRHSPMSYLFQPIFTESEALPIRFTNRFSQSLVQKVIKDTIAWWRGVGKAAAIRIVTLAASSSSVQVSVLLLLLLLWERRGREDDEEKAQQDRDEFGGRQAGAGGSQEAAPAAANVCDNTHAGNDSPPSSPRQQGVQASEDRSFRLVPVIYPILSSGGSRNASGYAGCLLGESPKSKK
ncbi:uncharacterized protein LOC126409990 isoform X2 [Nymphaea colorata]|uniref:uncharacterized protein LOC126409990 isoform X2 n=1 Tax=Nymphaea colorata TaxID=210225 RepID=UPI00214F1C33|nr:uncharacterized protein LOC126409990 isoform X2 [Nymphaea colorata]